MKNQVAYSDTSILGSYCAALLPSIILLLPIAIGWVSANDILFNSVGFKYRSNFYYLLLLYYYILLLSTDAAATTTKECQCWKKQ